MSYLLGIDIGTTGAKALIIRHNGRVASVAFTPYPISHPHSLWSEQNPDDWWRGTQQSILAVIADSQIDPGEITGVGLTGQMHGLVLLDNARSVIRPAILWNDQRTAVQCDAIRSTVGPGRLLSLTANDVLPGFTAPKLLWVREHEPAAYAAIAHILLPKDYIRFRLTGELATDVSDASGTSLFNVGRRSWASELLQLLDISAGWLPPASESPGITGKISRMAMEATGLSEGIPVVGGAGDQAAGGIGNGIVENGIVSVTIGTSGVVFAHADRLPAVQEGTLHTFCHAVPGKWHQMGVTLAAGGSLHWFRDVLGEPESARAMAADADPYEILSDEAATAPPGSGGLVFLPYLSGERTPHADPSARGAFIGLTHGHARPHLVRAIMEGVAFSLRDCLEMMTARGLSVRQIRISGGGARSRFWRQILADVAGYEMTASTVSDNAPFGAALLAGVGTGVFSSCEEACRATVKTGEISTPDQKRMMIYNDGYEIYRSLYPALKPAFGRLG